MTLTLTIALVPAFLLLTFLGWKDRQHPEPLSTTLKGLFFGICSVGISLCITSFLEDLDDPILDAFFNAAIPEEFAKLVMFLWLIRNNKNLDEPIDCIVYAAYVSLGFAALENILYLIDEGDLLSTGFMRAFFSVPGHFCFSICMGFCYGMGRFGKKSKLLYYPMAFIGPVLLHGTFDALLGSIDDDNYLIILSIWLVFCILMYRAALKRINKLKDIGEGNPASVSK